MLEPRSIAHRRRQRPRRAASATGWSPRSARSSAPARAPSGQPPVRRDRGPAAACPAWPTSTAPVDLVLLGVPDAALERAARRWRPARGDRSAVIFGSVVGDAGRPAGSLRDAVAGSPATAGLAVCGGGCMGFVNVARGSGRSGTSRPTELPSGPVAAGLPLGLGVLRPAAQPPPARLQPGRLVRPGAGHDRGATTSTTPSTSPRRRSSRCCWRRMRSPDLLRAGLARAAEQDVPVVALTVGTSGPGRGHGGGALRRARRGGRRLGGAVRRVPACCGCATWTSWPTRSSCSRPAADPGPARAASPPCTTPAPSGPWSSTWPTSWACRSRR